MNVYVCVHVYLHVCVCALVRRTSQPSPGNHLNQPHQPTTPKQGPARFSESTQCATLRCVNVRQHTGRGRAMVQAAAACSSALALIRTAVVLGSGAGTAAVFRKRKGKLAQ